MSIPREQRTTKERPCPACGHTGWCFFTVDNTAVWCGRIATYNGKQGTPHKSGWVHKLTADAAPVTPRLRPKPRRRRPPFAKFLPHWQRAAYTGPVAALAKQLGVSPESLRRIGIGWVSAEQLKELHTECLGRGCWTFPMRDATGEVTGIRLRTLGGFKYSIDGSDGSGIVTADNITPGQPLLCPEGPTSLAALLTLGANAVGRPNNRTGVEALRAYVKRVRPATVYIVGDNDQRLAKSGVWEWPGLDGANAVAREIPGAAVLMPPAEFKDVRVWLQSGARPADIQGWIAASGRRHVA